MRKLSAISLNASPRSTGRSGFALVVIAALFTAVAVVGTVALENKVVSNELTHETTQQVRLGKITAALNQYALRYGRLPCPAQASIPAADVDPALSDYYGIEVNSDKGARNGRCTAKDFEAAAIGLLPNYAFAGIDVLSGSTEMIRGMVPFKLLAMYGITEKDVYDLQKNRIMYVVNRNLTTDNSANNRAVDHALITDGDEGSEQVRADFVVISYGRDKLGGIPVGNKLVHDQLTDNELRRISQRYTLPPTIPCTANNSTRDENCDGDINFVKRPRNIKPRVGTGTTGLAASPYFDDEIMGGRVTCASGMLNRSSDGECTNTYCWGDNSKGQVGNDSTTDVALPTAVVMPDGVGAFQSISVSAVSEDAQTCAISASFDVDGKALPFGDVYCWGSQFGNKPTKLELSNDVVATSVQVGDSSSCMVGGTASTPKVNGVYPANTSFVASGIYCWGKNDQGQLGNGITSNEYVTTPTAVIKPSGVTFAASNSLSGDGRNWCAVGNDGKLYCWGNGVSSPTEKTAVGTGVLSVGGKGSIVYKTDGSLMGLGEAWVPSGAPPVVIYKSGSTSIASRNTFHLKEWVNKFDADGNLVLGVNGLPMKELKDLSPSTPVSINETSRDANISHQCISVDTAADRNKLYCRGNNSVGQLGIGRINSLEDSFQEVLMPVGANVEFTSISIGGFSSCALSDNGEAYCWGDNGKGQLGNGIQADAVLTPTKVTMPRYLKSFVRIVSGGNTSCALAPVK